MPPDPYRCGGIDIGGTKIEARLFQGTDAQTEDVRRVSTPRENFDAMLTAIADQLSWLESRGGGQFPVGLSMAGLIDPQSGHGFASNLPANGRALGAELAVLTGRTLPVVNDCMAFAYSESQGGAGAGADSVMGLILGTGVGGGFCAAGTLPYRHAGLAVEIGHVGLSAQSLARHGLPPLPCGCGRSGCVETYVSGTGVANIAEARMDARIAAEDLATRPDAGAAEVLEIWADLAGECLYTIQVMLDPAVIVLGGGLSKLDGIVARLTDSLAAHRLGNARPPRIYLARHGDSSGARGAALLARHTWTH